MTFRTALFSLLALTSGYAGAQDRAVAGKAGMLGLGIEYTHALNQRLGLRFGLNGSQFGFDAEESGIAYDFELAWDSMTMAVDFHPTRSPFRLTGGFLSNDNRLQAESRPTQNVTVGGTLYSPDEVGTLIGVIKFDSFAPFIGLGWDWSRATRRFGMSLDLGLLEQGVPRVSLTATGSLLGDPLFEADVLTEQTELQRALDDLELFPFATLGFAFRF